MKVRTVREDDWRKIDYLASNEVQEGEHTAFENEWTVRRRDVSVDRFHFVLEENGEVVSYAALEKDSADKGYRMFLVMDWSGEDRLFADQSIEEIERIAREQGINYVWMRELEDDKTLVTYVQSCGFVIDKRYNLDGYRFVNLSKGYEN